LLFDKIEHDWSKSLSESTLSVLIYLKGLYLSKFVNFIMQAFLFFIWSGVDDTPLLAVASIFYSLAIGMS
jgi:hypothetical protein